MLSYVLRLPVSLRNKDDDKKGQTSSSEVAGDATKPKAGTTTMVITTMCLLSFVLPSRYPMEPPRLELKCKAATRKSLSKANTQLRKLASQLCTGAEGQESAMELIDVVKSQLVLEGNSNKLKANGNGAKEKESQNMKRMKNDVVERKIAEGELSSARLLRIDHMNDSKGYMKLLRKWTDQLGLRGELYFRNGARRVEDVFVLLVGDVAKLKDFCLRLRTQCVDVNSRGMKCKEKQSRVLWEGEAVTVRGTCTPIGLRCTEYKKAEELVSFLLGSSSSGIIPSSAEMHIVEALGVR